MALKTSLRPIARRISEAVESYATSQGLSRGDYALVGSFDEKTGRISLTLGTGRQVDERRWYADILQAIRRSFPGDPQVTMHIGLVIQRVQDLDEIYANALAGDDEVDLTELLERT
jgi:hypothetical protein